MVQQIEITLKPKRRGFHLVTMLKSKAIMVVATIVTACGGQKSPQNGGHVNSSSQNVNKCLPVIWQMTE